jgi:hypothetical protein
VIPQQAVEARAASRHMGEDRRFSLQAIAHARPLLGPKELIAGSAIKLCPGSKQVSLRVMPPCWCWEGGMVLSQPFHSPAAAYVVVLEEQLLAAEVAREGDATSC